MTIWIGCVLSIMALSLSTISSRLGEIASELRQANRLKARELQVKGGGS